MDTVCIDHCGRSGSGGSGPIRDYIPPVIKGAQDIVNVKYVILLSR